VLHTSPLSLHDALPIYVRPLFEGIGPPPAYRWVKPPAALASNNVPPAPNDTDIPMGPSGSQQSGAQSEDNQLVLNLAPNAVPARSEEHTSELQSRENLV